MTCNCIKTRANRPTADAHTCPECRDEHLRLAKAADANGDRHRAVWHLARALMAAPPAERPALMRMRIDYQLRRPVDWPEVDGRPIKTPPGNIE